MVWVYLWVGMVVATIAGMEIHHRRKMQAIQDLGLPDGVYIPMVKIPTDGEDGG